VAELVSVSGPDTSPSRAIVAATSSFYTVDASGVVRKFGAKARHDAKLAFAPLGILKAETTRTNASGTAMAWCSAHRVLLVADARGALALFNSLGRRLGTITDTKHKGNQVKASSVRVSECAVVPGRYQPRTQYSQPVTALAADDARGDVFVGRADGSIQVGCQQGGRKHQVLTPALATGVNPFILSCFPSVSRLLRSGDDVDVA